MMELYKNRSATSCIQAAYNLLTHNFKGLFRCLWLPALLFSVICAALVTMYMPNADILAFAMQHSALYIGSLAVLMVGLFVTGIWAIARMMAFLNEKSRKWNFGRVSISALNMLAIVLLAGAVITLAAFLLFGFGTSATPAAPAPGEAADVSAQAAGVMGPHFTLKAVTLGVLVLLILLSLLPLVFQNMKYLNEPGMGYWKSFLPNYKTGLRYIGLIFVTMMLTEIIAMLVTVVVRLPSYVLVMAQGVSYNGAIYGDPQGLPGYFPYLMFGTWLIVFFVLWLLWVFEWLVMYFLYGSIQQKQKERQETRMMIPTENATVL